MASDPCWASRARRVLVEKPLQVPGQASGSRALGSTAQRRCRVGGAPRRSGRGSRRTRRVGVVATQQVPEPSLHAATSRPPERFFKSGRRRLKGRARSESTRDRRAHATAPGALGGLAALDHSDANGSAKRYASRCQDRRWRRECPPAAADVVVPSGAKSEPQHEIKHTRDTEQPGRPGLGTRPSEPRHSAARSVGARGYSSARLWFSSMQSTSG